MLLAVGVLATASGVYTFDRVRTLGAFHSPMEVPVEVEMIFDGIPGPEDLQLADGGGLVFISSSDRRARQLGADTRGQIYLVDLSLDHPEPQRITPTEPQDFHPHGISLYPVDGPPEILQVINRRSEGAPSVEIYRWKDGGLIHLETLRDPALVSPNNLTATGPRAFYFTNDGRSPRRSDRSIDTFLRRSTGNIGYFDGQAFSIVVEDLHFPNGIHLDAETGRLYVVETTTGKLKIFEMESSGSGLRFLGEWHVGMGPDNINAGPGRTLLIGCHPNLPALNRHIGDPNRVSPSKVIQVDPETGAVEILYSNAGAQLSGASSAVLFGGRLLVGAAYDSRLLLGLLEEEDP